MTTFLVAFVVQLEIPNTSSQRVSMSVNHPLRSIQSPRNSGTMDLSEALTEEPLQRCVCQISFLKMVLLNSVVRQQDECNGNIAFPSSRAQIVNDKRFCGGPI